MQGQHLSLTVLCMPYLYLHARLSAGLETTIPGFTMDESTISYRYLLCLSKVKILGGWVLLMSEVPLYNTQT